MAEGEDGWRVDQERRIDAGKARCEKDKEDGGGGRLKYGGLSDEDWLVLLNDHAMGQVLGVVFEELSGGTRTVGQLQFFQLLQLDEAWQPSGGQQGAAWRNRRKTVSTYLSSFRLLAHR